MIKLVASDLDGTLLQNGAQSLNPSIFPIIRKLHKKGIHFVAASGRQYYNLQNLFHEVKDDISYVCEGGSMYVHNDQVHIPHTIDPSIVQNITKTVHHYQDCELAASCTDHMYIEAHNPAFKHHMCNVIKNDITTVDNLLSIPGPVMKMAVYNPPKIHAVYERYHALFSDVITVVHAGSGWVDFIPFGTDKGFALNEILKKLSIAPDECMVFGDQWNDLPMLKLAGTSFAMANAVPGIAAYCTGITDSVEKELEKLL